MATTTDSKGPEMELGGGKHEHPLIPLELGHPVTVTPAQIPAGTTAENVAVVELPRRFRRLSGNDFPMNDWVAAFDVVKNRYGDCFDMVVFFTDPRLPRIPYSGYHRGVYNEVAGINRGAFNSRAQWNSERLQSQVWMGRFSLGTLLQEVGHRWGSFVRYRLTAAGAINSNLLLPGGGHWAREFDDGDSPMDYDEERHVRQTANTWLREPIGGFEFEYSNLDLYLMGLIGRLEVGRFTLIQNYTEIGGPLSGGRQMVQGTPRNLAVGNVILAEGPRVPDHTGSQQFFRVAFVVVTRDASRLDNQYLLQVEVLRRQLEQYFSIATKSRGCIDATLCCRHSISRSGTIVVNLRRNRITWSNPIHHGLGPIPVKVEIGIEDSIGGTPISVWSREETPDITTGVQHLAAQVNRSPFDGTFKIVAQRKGGGGNTTFRWWATATA